MPLSGTAIYGLAISLKIPPKAIDIQDELYGCLTRETIQNEIAETLNAILAGLKIKWGDKFDCNRYSKLGSVAADLCSARSASEVPPAFGSFVYRRAVDGIKHSINVAVHYLKDWTLTLAFYEPQQSLAEVKLSPEEIQSCEEFRFA